MARQTHEEVAKLITFALVALLSGPALPTSAASQSGGTDAPIDRVTVVGRTTVAVDYRSQDDTRVDLVMDVLDVRSIGRDRAGDAGQ